MLIPNTSDRLRQACLHHHALHSTEQLTLAYGTPVYYWAANSLLLPAPQVAMSNLKIFNNLIFKIWIII